MRTRTDVLFLVANICQQSETTQLTDSHFSESLKNSVHEVDGKVVRLEGGGKASNFKEGGLSVSKRSSEGELVASELKFGNPQPIFSTALLLLEPIRNQDNALMKHERKVIKMQIDYTQVSRLARGDSRSSLPVTQTSWGLDERVR